MSDVGGPVLEWRQLAEAFPGPVGIQVDAAFVHVSAELAETVGADRDELVGEPWQVLFDRSEAERLERDALPKARAGDRWAGEARTGGPAVDATPVHLTLSGAGGEAIVWVVSAPRAAEGDRTERATGVDSPADAPERGRRPLHARPAFVRSVLDAIDDVLYVIDEDGRSYFWNETLVETTGYSHEEIDAMHPRELLPADQHEYVPGLVEAIDAIDDRRVDLDILTKDGERIPHEFRGTTFEDPRTGRVFRCGLARDVSERRARERELERSETIIETVDDGVYALDGDLRFTFANEALCELLETPREDLLGTPATALFSDEDERELAAETRERVVAGDTSTGTVRATVETSDGERILESNYRLHPEPDGTYRGSVGVIRDVTEREERERTLERQRDELATLDRINELLLATARELVQAADRDAVERTICERLAASELYEFAWIGEPAIDGDRVVPRASAGVDRDYLDAVATGTDRGFEPVERALETGTLQVATVEGAALEPSEGPEAAGFESVAAVPIRHQGTVYAVLAVHATREGAFTDREQAGFDVLARTVGLVVHAARSRNLLFADAAVEFEFAVRDAGCLLVRLATDLGCELTLEGYVPSGEQWVLYLAVDGAPPDELVAAASGDRRVERARVVTAGEDGGRIELVVSASSLVHAATGAGATVQRADVDPDGARLTVEAPIDADTREVVEHIRCAYPDSELLARRERDREVTAEGRPRGLLDELTDRQRAVLEAAYLAGYFDWPRESTAEEVAASLDLAGPTLHGHLRKAEATILSALLDGR